MALTREHDISKIIGRLSFKSYINKEDILELYITEEGIEEDIDIHLDVFLDELKYYIEHRKRK